MSKKELQEFFISLVAIKNPPDGTLLGFWGVNTFSGNFMAHSWKDAALEAIETAEKVFPPAGGWEIYVRHTEAEWQTIT